MRRKLKVVVNLYRVSVFSIYILFDLLHVKIRKDNTCTSFQMVS